MRRKIRPPPDDYPAPWEDRPISPDRWRRHRERMMANHFAGRRPPEWWLYERQMQPPSHPEEAATLYAMGELAGEERNEVMRYWRDQYERALEPGFGHCIGHKNPSDTFASWLDGEAARKAHHDWAGIPRKLVRQWDHERKRQGKIIRDLGRVLA